MMQQKSVHELINERIANLVDCAIKELEAEAAPAPAPVTAVASEQKPVAAKPPAPVLDLKCPPNVPRGEWLLALRNIRYGVPASNIGGTGDVPSDETVRRENAYARSARARAAEARAEQSVAPRPAMSDVAFYKMFGKPRTSLCAGDAAMLEFKRTCR
jgi:hypothetical protein